jgi:predicted TIM-barrel fold metal-dependent hydrolase
MRDEAPFVELDEEGVPFWVVDGGHYGYTTGNGASGRPIKEWVQAPQKYEEFRRGVWDPVERIRDMELNGVWASLNFPSLVWGFAGTRFASMRDPDVGFASLQAYNDWVIDEWCAADPARLIPCQLAWLPDPERAADEIRRNAERGFRAVSFSENPEPLGYPSIYDEHWDPLLAACADTGTVVNLHVGSSGVVQYPSSNSATEASVALFPVNGIIALVDWIFARVPLRFPDIKVAMSEAGASWVPMAMERLSRGYRQRAISDVWQATDPHPVDLVHRNFWFTSIEDPSAFRMLDLIGADKIMVESDYPHYDSSWPDTQAMIRYQLEHLDTATIRKVCFENAAAVYDRPFPPEELFAASVVGKESMGA